jgi:hypothetical protein
LNDNTVLFARLSGWFAAGLLAVAFSIPAGHWLLRRKRAPFDSRPVTTHIAIGMGAAGAGFLHPLVALLALGSPGAVGGGDLGLAFGGFAFMMLLAHTGLGLALRDPKLKKRANARRAHLTTASIILASVGAHAALCLIGDS